MLGSPKPQPGPSSLALAVSAQLTAATTGGQKVKKVTKKKRR